jgi:hypothetical protein
MSEWTLGSVKERNMEINALCATEGCRHLYVFDLDALIEGAGADYAVADIPPMTCPRCDGPLAIRLSFVQPEPDEE